MKRRKSSKQKPHIRKSKTGKKFRAGKGKVKRKKVVRMRRNYGSSPRVRDVLKKREQEMFETGKWPYYVAPGSGGKSGLIRRLDRDEDLGYFPGGSNPEGRLESARMIKKHLDDFKDWTKKNKLKSNSIITEFDGMNGSGIRGFTHVGGPSVDWETTVGNYIKDQQEEIKNQEKYAEEERSNLMEKSVRRFGKFKPFERKRK